MGPDPEDSDGHATFPWRHDMNEGSTKPRLKKRAQDPVVNNKRPSKRAQTEMKTCAERLTAAAHRRDDMRLVDLSYDKGSAKEPSGLVAAAESIQAKYLALADVVKARPTVAAQRPHGDADLLMPFTDYASAINHLAAVTRSDGRSMKQLQTDNQELQKLLTANEGERDHLKKRMSSMKQLQEDHQELQKLLTTDKKERDNLKSRLSSLKRVKADNEGLQQLLAVNASQRDDLKRRIMSLEQGQDEGAKSCNEMKQQLGSMESDNTDLRNLAEDLRRQLSTTVKERDRQKKNVKASRFEYDNLLRVTQELKKKQAILVAKHSTMAAELDAALTVKVDLEQQITGLVQDKESLAEINLALNVCLKQKDEKVRVLSLEHDRQSHKVDTMHVELREAVTRENELRCDLEEAQNHSEQRSNMATAAEAKNQSLSRNLQDADRAKSRLQRDLAKSDLQRQDAVELARRHEQTMATNATKNNDLTAQLQQVQTRLDSTVALLQQKDVQLQRGITELANLNKNTTDNVKKHERMAVESKKQREALRTQLHDLQTRFDTAAVESVHKETQMQQRIKELDGQRQDAMAELTKRKLEAAALVSRSQHLERHIQSLATQTRRTADEAVRRECNLKREIQKRDRDNEELTIFHERAKVEIARLARVEESSNDESAKLRAAIEKERDLVLDELSVALDVTTGVPDATLTRLGVTRHVTPPHRTTPYQGHLDATSIICGRGFTKFSSLSHGVGDAVSEKDGFDGFSRALTFHIIRVLLCLRHNELTDRCIELLWDIWGNLETTLVYPAQISRVSDLLTCMLKQVLGIHSRLKTPDMAAWLAVQLVKYLSVWDFGTLQLPIPEASGELKEINDVVSYVVGSCEGLSRGPDMGESTTGSGQLSPNVRYLPQSCTTFAANMDGHKVQVYLCHLLHMEVVFCAVETKDGRCLVWHGDSNSCEVIAYRFFRFLRLQRGLGEGAFWLFPLAKRTAWKMEMFAMGDLHPSEEDVVERLSRDF